MLDCYIADFIPTGSIAKDVPRYLGMFGHQKTSEHCTTVASKANALAARFDVDLNKAALAGHLHDISAVIPNHEKIAFARDHKVDVLCEEEQFPMIIHQKLSVVLAREIFQITDNEVLSAIGCHTTLKSGASSLDKVVFLADKIAWDQAGTPPYINQVTKALNKSLDSAALAYINYLWKRRTQLRVVHPWLIEAHQDLMSNS